jgi:hypothetical protein
MSLEAFVLSDRRLASIQDWQQAIDAEGFKLALSAERSLDRLSGYLPALWEQTATGFECDHWNVAQLMDENSDIDFGHRWKHALAFRWGGDLDACLGAYMAATAYARATEGIVLDCEEGKLLTPQQARENVNRMERDLPALKNTLRKILNKQA